MGYVRKLLRFIFANIFKDSRKVNKNELLRCWITVGR